MSYNSNRVKELVNLRLSDLLPIVGLKNYLNRNDDPDGEFGPAYNELHFFQGLATSLALSAINIGYLVASYKSIESLLN